MCGRFTPRARLRFGAETQRTTEQRLIEVVEAGLTDGHSHSQLAAGLRESLGGDTSKTRAMIIARTNPQARSTPVTTQPRSNSRPTAWR
jgi:hypothetical protein